MRLAQELGIPETVKIFNQDLGEIKDVMLLRYVTCIAFVASCLFVMRH